MSLGQTFDPGYQDMRQMDEEEESSLYMAADRIVDHFVSLGSKREWAQSAVYEFVGIK